MAAGGSSNYSSQLAAGSASMSTPQTALVGCDKLAQAWRFAIKEFAYSVHGGNKWRFHYVLSDATNDELLCFVTMFQDAHWRIIDYNTDALLFFFDNTKNGKEGATVRIPTRSCSGYSDFSSDSPHQSILGYLEHGRIRFHRDGTVLVDVTCNNKKVGERNYSF